MSRLVVVSNRVGELDNTTQTGGLAVAMADALRARGGMWLGWDGKDPSAGATRGEKTVTTCANVTCIGIPLPERDYRNFYIGYSNSVLWPLFHYRTDLVEYRSTYFDAYMRVNRRFAEALVPLLNDDDTVWVHDYHLIPLAGLLRAVGCRQRIGFFLHIPFPPPEVLSALPNHEAIARAMLEYDLVGLQTSTDLENFHRYIEHHRSVGKLLSDGTVRAATRLTRTGRFPICIDVEDFRRMAEQAPDDVRIDQMRQHILQRKQIVGVDRLDYSKGIPARFQAFEKLLVKHPEMEKAVSFLQIAPPTREAIKAYAKIRDETEGLAGAINGRHADFNWTPIRYIHRSVDRARLAAIFRFSEVGLVTPLRDGMNLVAKEYVAAQDPEDPGVLVLSQFAGAAEEMHEALIVNPHDIDEMADNLFNALTMPLAERQRRHRALYKRIADHDVKRWAADFLETLGGPSARPAAAGERASAGRADALERGVRQEQLETRAVSQVYTRSGLAVGEQSFG